MKPSGITFTSSHIDDHEIVDLLPSDLAQILRQTNGFILHYGAFHFRGASLKPDWHSLRLAWFGKDAFSNLYDSVLSSDIPFAEDFFGDQFLLRGNRVVRLSAEDGGIEDFSDSLSSFFESIENDIEDFLNISLKNKIEPGQLLLAYPPFCTKEAADGVSLKPCPAAEVISFHAEFSRKIRSISDGEKIQLSVKP